MCEQICDPEFEDSHQCSTQGKHTLPVPGDKTAQGFHKSGDPSVISKGGIEDRTTEGGGGGVTVPSRALPEEQPEHPPLLKYHMGQSDYLTFTFIFSFSQLLSPSCPNFASTMFSPAFSPKSSAPSTPGLETSALECQTQRCPKNQLKDNRYVKA